MRLTAVGKIILGFVFFGGMLLITNIISYIGLTNIRASAENVIQEKMPLQDKMSDVQTDLLFLAKLSTTGFNLIRVDELQSNQSSFDASAKQFEQHLIALSRLVGKSREYSQAEELANQYLLASRSMYASRNQQLTLESQITDKAAQVLDMADEASALMMDLSYLEVDHPSLDTLVGTGTNIDNKIGPMLTAIKEFGAVKNAELSDTVRQDLEFAVSNIEADSSYLNRLASEIDTDGIVDMFNQQFTALKQGLSEPDGLFALKAQMLNQQSQAVAEMSNAEAAFEQALDKYDTLSEQVKAETLTGQDLILEAVNSNIVKSTVILLFALGVVVFLGTLATRSISKPLNAINKTLKIISEGDLSRSAREVGNDEFTQLAKSVNQLVRNLRDLVSQILQQQVKLEQATQHNLSLSEATLEQVAQQQAQVNQTAEKTLAVRETSQSTLSQIDYSTEQLSEAVEQSKIVDTQVTQSCDKVRLQAQQAKSSAKLIEKLEQNSHNIGGILDVIKTIAEQTNLLALNAAIEAARAGEQGRGFAVVADEVRTLATRSHESTKEIEDMILSLQQDAGKAVKGMEVSIQQAGQSVDVIEKVSVQVSNITGIVQGLTNVNQKIAQDTHGQDTLLDQVNDNLTSIVELAEQSATTTSQATEATQQVSSLMDKLKQAVASFKI